MAVRNHETASNVPGRDVTKRRQETCTSLCVVDRLVHQSTALTVVLWSDQGRRCTDIGASHRAVANEWSLTFFTYCPGFVRRQVIYTCP